MNPRITALLVAFALLGPAHAELHQFTSVADATQTFWGHLANYNAETDQVTVRRKNGRAQVFPAAKLCEADREWVKHQYEIIKVGRFVKIDAKMQHGDRKITKSSDKKEIDSSKYFDIEISNTSREEVGDLTIQYEIHVTQGGERGVIKGEAESISTLFSGVPHRFKSTEVNLSQKIPLSTASGGAGCST
jgi:hypothetical protein